MSNSGSDETVEVLEIQVQEEESVEPSMSEWSSLVMSLDAPNQKRVLYEQGLYEPGSGEICAAYVSQSDSAVFRHVYYNYPCIPDPGISHALLGPAPKPIYPDDGQELYLTLCKQMNQTPVRIFYRALLGNKADLSYYCVNPYGIQAMAKSLINNRTLTTINLTDNFLNDDACFHLGEMLTNNTALTELNLSGCRIGPSGALRLCAGLPKNKGLKVLNLSRNQLGDAGTDHFAGAIFSQANVQEVNLSNNGISGKSAQTLSEALEWNNKITYLDLSRNLLYSFPSGLCNLLNELGDSTLLKYINLSWNSLCGTKTSGGIKQIFKAKNLQHLDISNNKLSTTEVAMDLIASMAKPKKMVTYNVSYNPISAEDSIQFINKLQTKVVKIQKLYMDGINVNDKFIKILDAMKQLPNKQDVEVTYGYVEGLYKATGPDPRETTLDRVEYICKKPKKHKVDIALVIYQLLKEGNNLLEIKEFTDAIKSAGVVLEDGLIAELTNIFSGPTSKKGAKTVDIAMMAEYMKRKWPERKLPPTPPPEPEPIPEPVPEKGKKGGKEAKGKGKK
ncbi:leucine-rich repeat-containing protein 74B-like [Cydia pomonella]|uniref:leucine-rich repeat-containing protein 74B-like n=1 Tax=Cydia pomonella TaxID=82600 RepID=UPI002ADE262B|nr:leucine-rich repeat-containing protein 74B-like [Cydia pomonella]